MAAEAPKIEPPKPKPPTPVVITAIRLSLADTIELICTFWLASFVIFGVAGALVALTGWLGWWIIKRFVFA